MRALICLVLVLGSVPAVASESEAPSPVLTVWPYLPWPDLLAVGATVHTPASIDVQVGCAYTPLFGAVLTGIFARGGPRWELADWRNEHHRGPTLAASALVGFRYLNVFDLFMGPNAVMTIEGSYWFAGHFGLTLQLGAGASYAPGDVRPEAWLQAGLAF